MDKSIDKNALNLAYASMKNAGQEKPKICVNCTHFRKVQNDGGWCMYNPPVVIMVQTRSLQGDGTTPMGVRPTTANGDTCSKCELSLH